VQWGNAPTRPEFFPGDSHGWQLRRDVFDRVMLASARRAGADIVEHASARTVSEPDADGMRTVAYDGNVRGTVRGRWILDCTGRAGILARRGWRNNEHVARTLAVVGVWTPKSQWDLPNDSHTMVESYASGWAWSIPVSSTERYVTVMVDPARTAIGSGTELTKTYLDALGETVAMRQLMSQGTLVGQAWAREASPYGFSTIGEDGALLVGDAASFVDPLSSFGIKKALASAWLAAVVTRSALRDASVTAPAIALYESREREMHDELQRQAALLARDAAAQHASSFWGDRSAPPVAADESQRLLNKATSDAFEQLRSRPRVWLQRPTTLAHVPRAIVTGNHVSVVPHLVTESMPHGVRFVRNVDVVLLSEIAESSGEVPQLFDMYNRRTQSRVQLSDFLAALSTMVGTGMLQLLDTPANES
jgi:flavin-dependent dehydrogenase